MHHSKQGLTLTTERRNEISPSFCRQNNEQRERDQRPCHRDLRGVGRRRPVALCTKGETKIGQGGVKRRDIHRNLKKIY
jgi:hypothetical protein